MTKTISDDALPAKHFILFDGRAKAGDTDNAVIMDVADTEGEARRASKSWRDYDVIWYEYKFTEVLNGTPTYEEVGPRWDIGKGLFL